VVSFEKHIGDVSSARTARARIIDARVAEPPAALAIAVSSDAGKDFAIGVGADHGNAPS
jgi:hypothetical protein